MTRLARWLASAFVGAFVVGPIVIEIAENRRKRRQTCEVIEFSRRPS